MIRRLLSLFTFSIFSLSVHSQTLDTLVDVGGYNMHFKIIKGSGVPILFDAGAGNDGSVWDNILDEIHKVTGTTLITYDRSGFGKSELNPKLTKDADFGILNGMKELETGLSKLGYDKDIILVPHSYGGFYTTLYASRHPEKVRFVVRVDANLVAFYTDKVLEIMAGLEAPPKTPDTMGNYYLVKNYPETVKLMRTIDFPKHIPVVDIISPLNTGLPDEFWTLQKQAHKDFVNAATNREELIAEGSGHYIFKDNPALVTHAIIRAYATTVPKDQGYMILEKALDNAVDLAVEAKKTEMEGKHSEEDLNNWGYALLAQGEIEKATQIFKLNTMLFPDSFNVFDSYGEALLMANNKIEAIKMYEKSIALNPDNENAKTVLLKIKEE